jgi:hypothetical protein
MRGRLGLFHSVALRPYNWHEHFYMLLRPYNWHEHFYMLLRP